MRCPGLIIAAPSSGSGKTTVTLGLLRALTRAGVPVRGAKSGPDYIDPKFHEAACGRPCVNLDAWAMTPDRIRALAAGEELLIVEGAMGLFDGAPPNGKGATADLARILGIPVVLVIDAARMAQSVAPLVTGFARHDPDVHIAGVILNRAGSDRHEEMLRKALDPLDIPVLGCLRRDADLLLPSRHLGLVQAEEHIELDTFLNAAAEKVVRSLDLDLLEGVARPVAPVSDPFSAPGSPPKRIAIARDEAFAFSYPHQLAEWRDGGAELQFFSPLADERVPEADRVFLPGGYPELHAGRLAGNGAFLNSLKNAAKTSEIYGECGGYMVLGEALIDAEGHRHEMAGLLDLVTSFANRKLTLGYRNLTGIATTTRFRAHEFHYATTVKAKGEPLWQARDAEGKELPQMGLIKGNVSGSFAHIIDAA